jgi:twitching motility two-component system response regulator PilH
MGLFGGKKEDEILTVLHIDDSRWIRMPVSVILRRKFGMRVLEADSGLEGLSVARTVLPDLIISDIMMPGMDGFEVLAALRRDPSTHHIPVIMCTARDVMRDVNTAIQLGAMGFITKPIEEEMLIAKVAEVLTAVGKWGVQYPAQSTTVLPPGADDLVRTPEPNAVDEVYHKQPDATAMAPAPAKANAIEPRQCQLCQGPLSYIGQYQAWYCYACRKYPDYADAYR